LISTSDYLEGTYNELLFTISSPVSDCVFERGTGTTTLGSAIKNLNCQTTGFITTGINNFFPFILAAGSIVLTLIIGGSLLLGFL